MCLPEESVYFYTVDEINLSMGNDRKIDPHNKDGKNQTEDLNSSNINQGHPVIRL